jgi:hypothetical protein
VERVDSEGHADLRVGEKEVTARARQLAVRGTRQEYLLCILGVLRPGRVAIICAPALSVSSISPHPRA